MAQAPGNKVAAALQIPVAALLRADHGGDALGNRGLFTDYKSHFSFSFRFGVMMRSRKQVPAQPLP
ncbi:hypothetical protein SDC9_94868 [bioreactor metagenome]|uniref:Uncharacterized protein n=1 Tax=bioreactor metagenome TaxID=1076179 RepID=A0A645A4M3_9ZZZZ